MPNEERKAIKPIKIDNKIEDVKRIENDKAATPETIEANIVKPM
jgi:hypothetical protein